MMCEDALAFDLAPLTHKWQTRLLIEGAHQPCHPVSVVVVVGGTRLSDCHGRGRGGQAEKNVANQQQANKPFDHSRQAGSSFGHLCNPELWVKSSGLSLVIGSTPAVR